MKLSTKERKIKGQENRGKIADVRHQKENETYKLPHRSELTTGPRMPVTQREMQAHLTGRYPNEFRGPINRAERRAWDRWWKLKGRGFTKPMKKGEKF